ncbi:carbamoyltransferase [Streptomyces sp. NPDC001401]|uniref:carbamoyltransferase family protein n=1 Tax=Streptomyces sp. NPDC001401 TaxID=3364570 RepID=UPI00368F15C7
MIILGLAGGLGHDASAALVIDGRLHALAEEERFNRLRHAPNCLPLESTAHCLASAGITMADVDVIATSWLEADRDNAHRDMYRTMVDHPCFAGGRRPQWEKVKHPLAHAAASFHTSGFDEATVVSVDGVGDGVSTLIGHARGGSMRVLREYDIADSLGMFYLGVTNYLGFRFGQEGKVMGLASYAKPDEDWMPFTLDDEGIRSGLALQDPERPDFGPPLVQAWKARVAERFGPPRRPGYSYSRSTARSNVDLEPDAWRKSVAASGQHVLERVLSHIVEGAVRETGCRNVVIGGGVGYNCTANGSIRESKLVDRLFVFPASGDAGTSAGAALAVAASAGEHRGEPLATAALGAEFEDADIADVLRANAVPFTAEDDIAGAVAALLVDGKTVGWFQGRAEAGPRALGQRSILASPLTRSMHERVNTIKNREQWRPLAPSLTRAAADAYLVNPGAGTGPERFMLAACAVRESERAQIPAVVHVDGSCRPQIVDDGSSPTYHRLLQSVGTLGHPEIVLNTSFNLANEPVVNSPLDALRSFYGSGLDALAIGSMLVRKPAG